MAMAFHALADDLAVKYIERREQGGDAVALVIVGRRAGAPLLHRQHWLGPVEGLNLAFLIDRQDNGVVRRINVQPDDLLQFGRELRIVGELELPHAMRLKTMCTPYPLHRADADPRRLGHRRASPVAGCWRRPAQRQGNHTLGHFGSKRPDARWPRFVPPKPRRSFLAEPFLPTPDHGLGLPGRAHDLGSAMALASQKNDLRPPNVLLRAVAVRHHRSQSAPVGRTQSDLRSRVHSPHSHVRVSRRIHQRIEVLDLVH